MKKIIHTIIILSFLIMFLSSGCGNYPNDVESATAALSSTSTDQNNNQKTLEPYIFKTSLPNSITITGNLSVTNPLLNAPDRNDAIFLVPLLEQDGNVSSIPAFTVGDVPQAEVDERTGDFVFTNIQPGIYAVVVLTLHGQQVPARIMENGNLAIVTFHEEEIGQTIQLDRLSLP